MSIAERLKEAREHFGYTQKEMAQKCSVSLQMWQNYEWGKSVPGGKILESLARLGLNVNWILTGEDRIDINEIEKDNLLLDEAHKVLRKKIRDSFDFGNWRVFTSAVTYDKLRSYAFKQEYMPTDEELIELSRFGHMDEFCLKHNIDYKEFIKLFSNFETKKNVENTPFELDIDLLRLVYEVVEEIDNESELLSGKQKSALFAFVYQMNYGTKYTKKGLKRFIEAVSIFAQQGIDFDRISDSKMSDIVAEIVLHVVKGKEDEFLKLDADDDIMWHVKNIVTVQAGKDEKKRAMATGALWDALREKFNAPDLLFPVSRRDEIEDWLLKKLVDEMEKNRFFLWEDIEIVDLIGQITKLQGPSESPEWRKKINLLYEAMQEEFNLPSKKPEFLNCRRDNILQWLQKKLKEEEKALEQKNKNVPFNS